MLRSVLLLTCLTSALAAIVNVDDLGKVEGTTSNSLWTNKMIYEYRGIPYALPPSGDLRFKYPVKVETWGHLTFDATEYAPACVQLGAGELGAMAASTFEPDKSVLQSTQRRTPTARNTGRIVGQEDCLTLDVYTPTTNASANLPVMVWFHGGSFLTGRSSTVKPGFLLEKNIVLVAPQYRLGPLGYLYLNDESAPGNMGLADQAMALQWVRDNIAAFGGNPGMVTVAGSSAGGSSASLHMLNNATDASDRLFERAIALSGSSLSMWALEATDGEKNSRDVAKATGCDDTLPAAEVATCMRDKDVNDLMAAFAAHQMAQVKLGIWSPGASIPVVQSGEEGVPLMVPYAPQEVLERGTYLALPMMVGSTKHEGIFALDIGYQGYLVPNDLLEDSLFLRDEFITTAIKAYGVDENSRVMADACTRRYFDAQDLGDFTKMTPGLVDFFGVTFFKGSIFRQAELHSVKEKVYMYSFEYFGEHSLRKASENSVPIPDGVTHSDDTIYLFPREDYPLEWSLDLEVSQKMIHILTNFVIYGNPTPKEKPHAEIPDFVSYSRSDANYMRIENNMRMKTAFRDTFTTARLNGLNAPSYDSSVATITATPILILSAAAAIFFSRY